MDTEFPPPRPIDIVLSSDTEPVKCGGTFRLGFGGFVLEFSIGQDKYTVDYNPQRTVLCCAGNSQSYTLTLCAEQTQMLLSTVYGSIEYTVATTACDVSYDERSVRMDLGYTLSAGGQIAATRKVSLTGNLRN